jgi:hypothetical protein
MLIALEYVRPTHVLRTSYVRPTHVLQTSYVCYSAGRFFCGTWNVNGQPATERLDAWLCEHDIITNPPDVYAVGYVTLLLCRCTAFATSVNLH